MSYTITAGPSSIVLNVNTPLDTDTVTPTDDLRDDLIGLKVWYSTSTGFTPSGANLVYDGTGLTTTITGLTPGTSYYLRYALISEIEPDNYTLSSEITATPTAALAPKNSIAYLYQWATAQPGNPSGTSTYTWETNVNSTYSGGNGWSTTITTNPGTALIQLWTASKAVTDEGTAVTTSVNWSTGYSVSSISQNGASGINGLQTARPVAYLWAATLPSSPTGTTTYTWSTGSYSAPSGWSTSITSSPSTGFTLWAATVNISDTATATTTTINWGLSSIIASGYAATNGNQGASSRICYSKTTLSSLDTTPTTITTSGSASFPPNNSWGTGTVWVAQPPTITAGESVYQSDGIYDPVTGNTVWNVPYLSALKVGSLSAITANTGNLTVSGTIQSNTGAISDTTMTGSGAVIYSSGNFAVGNSTNNITYNGSAITLNGMVVFPANINSNNLTLKDGSGNVILGNGTPLNFANITPASGWLNNNITISAGAISGIGTGNGTAVANNAITLNSSGTLSGAGGGAVTITGLGTTGAFGGGQLAINTDFLVSTSNIPYGFGDYNNAGTNITFSIGSGGAVGNAKYWRLTTASSTPATTQFGFFFNSAATLFGGWKANTNYIVSFYAKSSNVSGSGFYSAWNSAPPTNTAISNPNITSTWQRYVWLINFGTSSIDSNGFWSIAQSNLPLGSQLDFSCIQVEVGDAVSGWSASTWIDASGQLQGTNGGAGTSVANNQITISSGAINGIGTGSGTFIANSLISLAANGTLSGAGGGAVTASGINAVQTDLANAPAGILNSNVSLGTLGAGAFAYLGQITSANVSTYITGAAIGTAQIGVLTAGNIGANTIDASKIAANTITADKIAAGTIWTNNLQVGSSPAISGTNMTGAGAVINSSGTFALGNSTTNLTFNGTTLKGNGLINSSFASTSAISISQDYYSPTYVFSFYPKANTTTSLSVSGELHVDITTVESFYNSTDSVLLSWYVRVVDSTGYIPISGVTYNQSFFGKVGVFYSGIKSVQVPVALTVLFNSSNYGSYADGSTFYVQMYCFCTAKNTAGTSVGYNASSMMWAGQLVMTQPLIG